MSLIDIAKSNPLSFSRYLIRQVVAIAGDGNLKDNTECSLQLRAYLETATADKLADYARECLDDAFTDSGFVLQDVVNELGRRLEFEVLNGRYRGVSNAVGYDGIWKVPGGSTILVEVKTTDTYNVTLETIAGYRQKLQNESLVPSDTSVLFVVGRKDTGSLEAQIRGSRFAWDMRVVGVESLLKLVAVKEKSSEDQTVVQIRELLRPFEYTRVDRILDVVFSAASDVVQQEENPLELPLTTSSTSSDEVHQQSRTPQSEIEEVRQRAAAALNNKAGLQMVRMRQSMFEDKEHSARACITVSKRYEGPQPYWYAYHPKWDKFLDGSSKGFVVYGCLDRSEAFAIPVKTMQQFLPSLNQTVKADGTNYWHVKLVEDGSELVLFSSKTGEKFSLAPYKIGLKP